MYLSFSKLSPHSQTFSTKKNILKVLQIYRAHKNGLDGQKIRRLQQSLAQRHEDEHLIM